MFKDSGSGTGVWGLKWFRVMPDLGIRFLGLGCSLNS